MDNAIGALLGAAVGDAVGAYLEFWHGRIEAADVDVALALPGGGCWEVGRGQFTDDTELALCLAHGLAGHHPSAGFPADSVALQYAWWCNESQPFDIGGTTKAAFRIAGYPRLPGGGGCAAALLANASNAASLRSQANGAAMRSTPLAIWAHRLPPPAIAAAARADALLSHPSQPCQDANAAYVLACAWLVARPGDGEGALAAAEGWAEQHACQEVRSWLAAARDDGAMAGYDARPAMGWLRHALQLAFYHLRRRSAFQPGLRHTLLCGGDTDTNAAIVCGLLGALHGAAAIPEGLSLTVEAYRWGPSGGGGHQRPEKLQGSQLRPLATRLFQQAAADAEQRGGQAGV